MSEPIKASFGTPIPTDGSVRTRVDLSAWWVDFFQKLFRGVQFVFGWQGPDVASANDLYLAVGSGNAFYVTGTTQINAIGVVGWRDGQEITLVFASTPIVKHNTAGSAGTAVMRLAGGADFSATANDLLTLKKINGVWLEKSRSVNG